LCKSRKRIAESIFQGNPLMINMLYIFLDLLRVDL
jgi:hypothetical protein